MRTPAARVSGEMSAEAGKIRSLLSRHHPRRGKTPDPVAGPGAGRSAARAPDDGQRDGADPARSVRAHHVDASRTQLDTEDHAARHGRPNEARCRAGKPEGLKGLARKLTAKKPEPRADGKKTDGQRWDMKTLLAAAEQGSDMRGLDQRAGRSPLDTAATIGRAGAGAGRYGDRFVGAGHRPARRRGLEALSRRRPRRLRAPPGRHD